MAILHQNRENFLELATDYRNNGFFREALGVLELALNAGDKSLSSHPILLYHAADLNEKLGNAKSGKPALYFCQPGIYRLCIPISF